MVRGFEHRLGAGKRRVGVLQLRRRIDGAAVLACVSVLVLRAAIRAFAFDVAVGEEHALHGIVELLDRLGVDQPSLFQSMKVTSWPCMRWNRTQMSAWMYSMMWPMWNGPFA